MVASAKLHHAQSVVEKMLPYEHKLHQILSSLLSSGDMEASSYSTTREVKRVAVVAFSSNSSLAGGFNSNVAKLFQATVTGEYTGLSKEDILVFPVGRKIYEAVTKAGFTPQGDFRHMADKPDYRNAGELARRLTEMFLKKEVDRIDLVYNHFKSMAVQIPTREVYLPVTPQRAEELETASKFRVSPDFILEPSQRELISSLLPKVLEMKIYAVLLDSAAAEHAARTVAMQLATDNANELLDELTRLYNKSRQQAITNELLDIVSGAASQ
jgi:F-type H+-transporting ATPase subunit gamma